MAQWKRSTPVNVRKLDRRNVELADDDDRSATEQRLDRYEHMRRAAQTQLAELQRRREDMKQQ